LLKNDSSKGKEVFLMDVEDNYAGFLAIDISEWYFQKIQWI